MAEKSGFSVNSIKRIIDPSGKYTIFAFLEKKKNYETMKILITGSAGFIGFHTAKKLLEKKHIIYG